MRRQGGDPALGPSAYAAGEALFDGANPAHLLTQTDRPVLKPELPYEKTGQYAAGTTFAEGLVYFHGKWSLYYGCADSLVAVATAPPEAMSAEPLRMEAPAEGVVVETPKIETKDGIPVGGEANAQRILSAQWRHGCFLRRQHHGAELLQPVGGGVRGDALSVDAGALLRSGDGRRSRDWRMGRAHRSAAGARCVPGKADGGDGDAGDE